MELKPIVKWWNRIDLQLQLHLKEIKEKVHYTLFSLDIQKCFTRMGKSSW